MAGVSIHLFGSVRVEQSGHEIPLRPASKGILLYLLLQYPRNHRREALASLFWGDMDDYRARRCLNSALWRLRQELGNRIRLVSNLQGNVGLELQRDDHLDIVKFENIARPILKKSPTSLDSSEVMLLEQTAALYQGDLAENCFYDWVFPERERLRALYLDILTLSINAYIHQGAYDQAIKAGQQLLQCDPLREDIHRQLMRLYIAIDQRSRALHQYMACWQVLHDELQLTPMPETTALYEQMTNRDPLVSLTQPIKLDKPLKPNVTRLKEMLHHLQIEIQHVLYVLQEDGD